MTAILGHAEQLSDNIRPSDPRASDLACIRDAAQLAAALTEQLLAVSRRQTRKPTVVNLNDCVDRARGVLHRLAGDGIAFEIRLDAALKHARVDAEQIEQVLLNLVVNARDAMPSGGALTVETRNVTLDETVAVIDSEVGRGSRSGVCFPATDDVSTGVIAHGGAPEEHIGSATVLLFENDQAVRTLVRDVLRRRGCDLLVASSPAEAMKFAAEHRAPIDLLIAEPATGPERDSEIVDAVCRWRPEMRVLYLEKPFTPDALARKVRAALAAA